MTDNEFDIGDGIRLTKVQPEDAEELFRLVFENRGYLKPWMPWAHTTDTVDDTAAFIGRSLQQDAEGRGFQCCIRVKGCKIVGVVGHVNIDHANRKTELGYWIGQRHQGRGIVTRAVRALVDHAFLALELNRIEIYAGETNLRSRAIPESLGFRLEGIRRQSEWVNDRYIDHAMYGLMRSEWRPES